MDQNYKNRTKSGDRTKSIFGYFLGIFEIGQKARKNSVEKRNMSLIHGQPKALIRYGAGRVPIFHGIDQEHEEREEHQEHEEHRRKSQIATTIQPTLISPFSLTGRSNRTNRIPKRDREVESSGEIGKHAVESQV